VELKRTLLALAGATVLLAALTSIASAGRLSTSSQQLRATFVSLEFEGAFGVIRCQVTIEGSFHSRTTTKTIGSLVGYITRAVLGPCSAGTATILTETLPWHVRYSGFEGTLPEISNLRAHVVGASLRVREPGGGVTCLARSTAAEPGTATFNRDTVTGALTTARVGGIATTGAECFSARATFIGTSSSFTVSNSTSRITISLI
jgi:hypothetical protein